MLTTATPVILLYESDVPPRLRYSFAPKFSRHCTHDELGVGAYETLLKTTGMAGLNASSVASLDSMVERTVFRSAAAITLAS
jgi:hypothetical protein